MMIVLTLEFLTEKSSGCEPLKLFLDVSWWRTSSVQAIYNKEILEIATFYRQLQLLPHTNNELNVSSLITSNSTKWESINLLPLNVEFLMKWLSMTIFPFLQIQEDPSSVKQLEDKSGSCFLKKHGQK